MILNDLLSLIENGSVHVVVFNSDDGLLIFKTIWHNLIPHMYMKWEIDSIQIKDYEIIIVIHDRI